MTHDQAAQIIDALHEIGAALAGIGMLKLVSLFLSGRA
jgi:hypothetical protein